MHSRSAAVSESSAAQPDDALRMSDGQVLHRRRWPVVGAARGVLIVHGLGEHIGRYDHVAAWFNARGLDVCGYDQRGHGASPGPRGALRRSDDLLTDLAAVYAYYARKLESPPLLLGHSMGGLVALRAALDGRVQPSALMLSSPALRSHAAWSTRALARGLAHVVPDLPLHNGLQVDALTHDATVTAAYRNDPLCHDRITPRLADFIFRAGAACIVDAATLDVPALLLVAGADRLVDASGSRDFSAAAQSSGQLTTRVFDALYHELFNEAEPGRTEVMRRLGDWLDPHM